MSKTINELVASSHGNAVSKGFYDQPNQILADMRSNPDWSVDDIKAVKDAFIAQRLMLITSELGGALESARKNKWAKEWPSNIRLTEENFPRIFEENVKDSVEDELADTAIRLFDLAGWLGIDLESHINMKATYNSTRAKMHGGKAF